MSASSRTWDTPGVGGINWRPFDRCLAEAAKRTVKLTDGRVVPQPVILTLPSQFMDPGARWYNTGGHGEPGVSADNPVVRLHLPPWMQNDAYRVAFQVPPSNRWYETVRYDGAFKQRMIEFVTAAGVRYNNHPQVSAIRIYVGFAGESMPIVGCASYWDVKPPKGGDGLNCSPDTHKAVMTAHESVITCSQYTAFAKELTEAAYRAFPNKPLVTMADAAPCTNVSGAAFRRILYTDSWPTTTIGLSMNNINSDRQDAAERPGNVNADLAKWTITRRLSERGAPVVFEYDYHGPSIEGMYWTELSGAANGGSFILHHSNWNASYSSFFWEVVDYWLNSDRRAWLVFRDREFPTYDYITGYGTSGVVGDFGKYLTLLNPEAAPRSVRPSSGRQPASPTPRSPAIGARLPPVLARRCPPQPSSSRPRRSPATTR